MFPSLTHNPCVQWYIMDVVECVTWACEGTLKNSGDGMDLFPATLAVRSNQRADSLNLEPLTLDP